MVEFIDTGVNVGKLCCTLYLVVMQPPALPVQAVDVTANRLTSIDPRLLALTGLRALNFRQNLLVDVSALSGAAFKGALEDLELRDNQLAEVPALQVRALLPPTGWNV